MRIPLNKKSLAACMIAGTFLVVGSGSAFAANVPSSAKEFKMHSSQATNCNSTFETALTSLVSKGTLTQEQASKILASFTSLRVSERGNPPDATTQKGGYFLSQFVKDGTLTQEQATAIETAMKTARESNKSMSDVLSELVSSGVITQAQSDTLTANKPNKEHARGFEFLNQLVKDGTITQEQKTAIQNELSAK